MIPIASGVRVWIATGHTDMRRGMNSLALLVQEGKHDPHGRPLRLPRQERPTRDVLHTVFEAR
jgi:transposase